MSWRIQSEAEIPAVVQFLSGVPVINLLDLDKLQELAHAFQVGEYRALESDAQTFRS